MPDRSRRARERSRSASPARRPRSRRPRRAARPARAGDQDGSRRQRGRAPSSTRRGGGSSDAAGDGPPRVGGGSRGGGEGFGCLDDVCERPPWHSNHPPGSSRMTRSRSIATLVVEAVPRHRCGRAAPPRSVAPTRGASECSRRFGAAASLIVYMVCKRSSGIRDLTRVVQRLVSCGCSLDKGWTNNSWKETWMRALNPLALLLVPAETASPTHITKSEVDRMSLPLRRLRAVLAAGLVAVFSAGASAADDARVRVLHASPDAPRSTSTSTARWWTHSPTFRSRRCPTI